MAHKIMRQKRYMLSSEPAKLLVFHLQWSSIFYAPWWNFYFMRFDAIIILCASRNFMPRQFSSLAGFYPDRGGVEVTGQTASLLAKAAPSLQHHSSIGSGSLSMTIFFKSSPPLTNYGSVNREDDDNCPTGNIPSSSISSIIDFPVVPLMW